MTATSALTPSRIGRYTIVGPLAMGGMAEVLLGRIEGPNGFQRPVVIKRILPHLSRFKPFVDMFVDEARIVARLHHPNIVQVFEHGSCDGELFLAMEYLEGESLAGVARRAKVRGTRVAYEVAARVLADACAGLHAAHELADADGVPFELVHRDVSPQNILVTYGGHVKILDFGVAKVRDRVSVGTEAGQLKGKFGYMAPEQVEGRAIDRRADVFSIGVVLYELTTGRQLFRRGDNQLAALWAARARPVLPPSRLLDDYPAELEAICLRALAREPDARYPTAAALRKDLLAAARRIQPDEDSEQIEHLMKSLFEDRIAQKREALAEIRTGLTVTQVPSGEVDEAVELPGVDDIPTIDEMAFESPSPGGGARGRWARGIATVIFLCALASMGRVLAMKVLPTNPASGQVSERAAPTTEPDTASTPVPASSVPKGDAPQTSAQPPAEPKPGPEAPRIRTGRPARAPRARPSSSAAATPPTTFWKF